jgi:hypothetical protein
VRNAVDNGTLRAVLAPTAASLVDKVALEIDRLLSEGLKLSDIAVISLRGKTAPDAIFRKPQIGRHTFVLADAPDMGERLVADSFLRWKGLERPAVILVDLPPPDSRQRAVRMYVALTRTLLVARLVGTRKQLAADPLLAAVL